MANSNVVVVDVFHTGLQMRFAEIRLSSTKTILEIKQTLERQTGTLPEFMSIELQNPGAGAISLDEDFLATIP